MAQAAFSGPVTDFTDKAMHRLEMLRRLIMNWGKHPVRQDVRQGREDVC